tara:strand:+ start:150 stop:695 length:546 start_codon:yes stop_codon:yes gene_type:complete
MSRPKGTKTIDDRARLLFMAELRAEDPTLTVHAAAREALTRDLRHEASTLPDRQATHVAVATNISRLQKAYAERQERFDEIGRRSRRLRVGSVRRGWRGNPREFIPPSVGATLLEGEPYARQEEQVRQRDAATVARVLRNLGEWAEAVARASTLQEQKAQRRRLAEQMEAAANYLRRENLD